MKYFKIGVLLILGYIIAIADLCAFSFKTIESFSYDWNNDGKVYSFLLEKIDKWNDPGDYHRLTIKIPGKKDFVLEDKYGLTNYTNYSHSQSLPISNNLLSKKSKYLVLTPIENNKTGTALLFVFGWEYSSRPGKLYIISLNSDGYPEIILKEELDILGLNATNNKGYGEIFGYHSYPEYFGPKYIFSSYCPRYVYAVKKGDSGVEINFDEKLTEEYNKKNYYWAGLKPAEEMVVVSFKNKKEKKTEFMSLKEAKAKYIK